MTSVILLHREASQISLFFLLMPHAAYKFVMFLFSKRLRNLDSISFSYTGNNESCLCRRRRHCKILGKEQKELGTIKIRRYSLQKKILACSFILSTKWWPLSSGIGKAMPKKVSKYDPYTDGVENGLSHAVGKKKIDTTRNEYFLSINNFISFLL